MSNYVLSPSVIKEATTFLPFKNIGPDTETAQFEEDVDFVGAALKPMKDGQTICEVTCKVQPHSTTNANVTFRTDMWLNDAICAGTVRPADADERDWKGTKAAIRTLTNLAKALGLDLTSNNAINALTDPAAQGHGSAHVTIRVFRANSGQHKWEISRASKVGA